jgi:hypothetical protein
MLALRVEEDRHEAELDGAAEDRVSGGLSSERRPTHDRRHEHGGSREAETGEAAVPPNSPRPHQAAIRR